MRSHDTKCLDNRKTPRYEMGGRAPRKPVRKWKPSQKAAIKRLDARIGRAECRRKLDALRAHRAVKGE